MSTSSALSISVLLISKMQLMNRALFLSYTSLFGSATLIVPLITVYASLQSHKSDCRIDVLSFISLFVLYILLD